jgi:hypothetical protein
MQLASARRGAIREKASIRGSATVLAGRRVPRSRFAQLGILHLGDLGNQLADNCLAKRLEIFGHHDEGA